MMSKDPVTTDQPEPTGRIRARVGQALSIEAAKGLELAAKVRGAVLILVVLWLGTDTTISGAALLWQVGTAAIFVLTSLLHIWAAREGAPVFKAVYFLVVVDLGLLAVLSVMPSPFVDPAPSPALMLRFVQFHWVFIILIQVAFAQSPRLILWTGFWIVVFHLGQTGYVLLQPGTVTELSASPANPAEVQALFLTRDFVFIFQRVGEVVFTLAITAVAAVLVLRSRNFVVQQALTERSRAQLARYVPAPVVDEISHGRGPFRAPDVRTVAIAFIDIVGFTRYTDTHPPEDVMAMLRQYHRFSVDILFRHGGAVDKFIGDGIMATFGITDTSDDVNPADAALLAAHDLIAQAEFWTAEREAAGEDAIRLSIGLDMGPAVFGNVGVAERLELAVIGDPVNVAARIERLTRDHNASLAVTERLLKASSEAVRKQLDLTSLGKIDVRGRDGAIGVSILAPRGSSYGDGAGHDRTTALL